MAADADIQANNSCYDILLYSIVLVPIWNSDLCVPPRLNCKENALAMNISSKPTEPHALYILECEE